MTDLMTPTYAKNMRIIGHTDQGGGRADGVQMMVHKGHAFIGHVFSKGFSVIDVRDPTKPTPVNYIAAPPNTWIDPSAAIRRPVAGDPRQGHVRAAGTGRRKELLQGQDQRPR